MDNKEYTLIKKQLISLMDQSDLTINGLAEGTNLSSMTIRKILLQQTKPSVQTLEKITAFFEITISQLFSEKLIKIKRIEDIEALKDFYEDNKSNPEYFNSRSKEGIATYFLRNVLIKDQYFSEPRRAKEIHLFIKENPKYSKNLNPKVIAKILERMYNEGILKRMDKTGKKSVFYYSINS
jgi:transcriptional regulator with XRE-family HTH domain